jgi:hypothetical protein
MSLRLERLKMNMIRARLMRLMFLGCCLSIILASGACRGEAAKTDAQPSATAAATAATSASAPTSVEQANIFKDMPEQIDARARYLFYLHGRIIEDKGARAVHERHGVYEYERILETFKGAGFVVISEARAKDTDIGQYAAKVVAQINALLKAGVAPRGITVVGASKGSGIAMHVSSLLKQRNVHFVIMAGCGEQTLKNPALNLYGRVLSIYDASDEGVGTCESLFARSAGLNARKEIQINLGLGHGFLYRPHKEWIDPAIEWAKQS